MIGVHPPLDQSAADVPPQCFNDYVAQAVAGMGIDTTSKTFSPDQLDYTAILDRAMELYIADSWRTIPLADAAWRSKFVATLKTIQPDNKVGKCIKNLKIFGCSKWLLESPDASDVVNLIGTHAESLRLLYIGSEDDYLDWAALSPLLQSKLNGLMQGIRVLILERVKNIPLSLFCSLKYLIALDLASVQIARDTAVTGPMSIPSIGRMAVHNVLIGNGQEGSETLDTISTLIQSPAVSLNALTKLYLDYLGCKGCSNVWKEVIAQCRDTIQYLRLYCGDGNDIVNLGALPRIRTLHLSVAANGQSVEMMGRLLNTLSTPGRTLSELSLGVDARETGDWCWADNNSSRDPEAWKAMDDRVFQLLGLKAKGVVFILSIPMANQAKQEVAQKALNKQFPKSSKWLQPIQFYAKGDKSLAKSFSLKQEEISLFI